MAPRKGFYFFLGSADKISEPKGQSLYERPDLYQLPGIDYEFPDTEDLSEDEECSDTEGLSDTDELPSPFQHSTNPQQLPSTPTNSNSTSFHHPPAPNVESHTFPESSSTIAVRESRLLNLPAEVRLVIYSQFSHSPHTNTEAQSVEDLQERDIQSAARHALRSVCKMVKAEWDPLFFSTASIIIKNPYAEWGWSLRTGLSPFNSLTDRNYFGPQTLADFTLDMISAPSLRFQQSFLSRCLHAATPTPVLSNIRKLRYDFAYEPYVDPTTVAAPLNNNFKDLAYFLKMLNPWNRHLPNLKEITISLPFECRVRLAPPRDSSWLFDPLVGIPGVFSKLDYIADWLVATGKKRSTGWTMAGRLRYEDKRKFLSPRPGQQGHGKFDGIYNIVELELVCTKGHRLAVNSHEWFELELSGPGRY